jgi:hypothetical protein
MSNDERKVVAMQLTAMTAVRTAMAAAALGAASLFAAGEARAQITCARTLTADVVAFDQPLMYNRLGAANINGMMYALKRDVVFNNRGNPDDSDNLKPLTQVARTDLAGNVELRPDKRPRPLVLRIARGDCLQVTLTNLLTPQANPNKTPRPNDTPPFNVIIDEQVADRHVGFHVNGMQLVNGIADDSSFVGKNANSLAGADGSGSTQSRTQVYTLYGEKEGVFLVTSYGSTVGADANHGNSDNGLFGQVIVEPTGARIYRSLALEEEMRLATTGRTASGHPIIDYEATYPNQQPWIAEGKAGLPILNTIQGNAIVHAELEAMVLGPNADGTFPPSTYPLESKGYRNPTVPNRLEPFRDFAQVWHDEAAATQAFPGFYNDPVFGYVLAGVKDAFMINFGSGGIGSEIIANRLGVGPMHDCLTCAYEEFFLTSFTVGDPAVLVDVPANVGLETLAPGQPPDPAFVGPKANYALYPADPSNVHHSYIGDFVKFRNTHVGKEQHVFHLHNHQWLYNPNDDNANYLDAQGLGPGVGYTYEINFGGSGNRNKSAGDAIFHCHFYPHFAQGMWYHWRNYDVLEEGTLLQASVGGVTVEGKAGTFHATRWALKDGTPAAGARALPDGEVIAGIPIVGIVPLPGKGMAPIPAKVTVKANPLTTPSGRPVGSLAQIDRADMLGPDGIAGTADDKNPGYPFWVAGIEDTVGQRPPTPVLDMLDRTKATQLASSGNPLWAGIVPDQADGHDGGLPRSALQGYAAGGATEANVVSARDFTKIVAKAKPVYFPEEGTDAEKVAMGFHSRRAHPTVKMDLASGQAVAATFIVNGAPPAVGAPFHEPCVDDNGARLAAGFLGRFFSGEAGSASASVGASLPGAGFMNTRGRSAFNADTPRKYKGVNIQFDAILNKVGYHFPQQRIITLWEDAVPVITKQQPPEPLVMRLNTFDCAVYSHTNLVPEYYEMDDYQVRTPTDIIGQHIHLPKWDLTTTDGAANGWNYEDGTLSPGAVRERIHAINEWNVEQACDGRATVAPAEGAAIESHQCTSGALAGQTVQVPMLHAKDHPYFGQFNRADWKGARTTMQRWFADPVVNTDGVDRGLGIIFTHDHYGPSSHQQIGLYATVLAQPAGSTWVHNETGQQLGAGPNGTGGRMDGGPTSWQAAILPPTTAPEGVTTKPETVGAFREFYFEFSDFQHAYEAGKYVGAGPDGRPLATYQPPPAGFDPVAWIPNPGNVSGTTITESFRVAINPPARFQINPLYPDLVVEAKDCVKNGAGAVVLTRPCPQAIDVEDPGMHVVNYRNEPIALRVFDPAKIGPDGRAGMQADGTEGDLAFALASKIVNRDGTTAPITRRIAALNMTEQQLGFWTRTLNAPTATEGGDPFTPMIRAYQGDTVRVKIQAGGFEEEHNAMIAGLKWLQGGSGFGTQPNAGWRNSQAAGISEQFTLRMPILQPVGTVKGTRDYAYNIDSSMDGWWSGTWGLIRTYDALRADLFTLPNNTDPTPARVTNRRDFDGVCPVAATARSHDVVAILANDLLPRPAGVTIRPAGTDAQHVGALLNAAGGTLVYNPRTTEIGGQTVVGEGGESITLPVHRGPLHDPTAMLYVRVSDLEPDPSRGGVAGSGACKGSSSVPGVANANCPVRLKAGVKAEPLVLRANAGECVNLTVFNRLPAKAPDLPTLGNLMGVNKRDRDRPEGSVPFDNNLIRASSHVGVVPQLLAVDVQSHLGMNVGVNVTQTVPPVTNGNVGKGTFRWYAGDLVDTPSGKNGRAIVATPVEFGGFGLSPADKIKQGQKSLVGGMVVTPQGATIAEDAGQHAQATITRSDGTKFRDFMLVLTKDLNQRYADGAAVEHMNGQGIGIPEDSQDNSAMALNYGTEPVWFRFGIAPQAPFGGEGCGPGCYGGIPNAHAAFSNSIAGNADPVTPVFKAKAGDEVRVHAAVPHGTSRGTTLAFHGHVWQRDPYVCPGEARNGLTGACNMNTVGSRSIGDNPMGFAQGAQESITPYSHFTFRFPKAGGANGVKGDYLFRDVGSFGSASGLWGILRVE